jgi:predicted membrane chloride channel (bestrophin family)
MLTHHPHALYRLVARRTVCVSPHVVHNHAERLRKDEHIEQLEARLHRTHAAQQMSSAAAPLETEMSMGRPLSVERRRVKGRHCAY